MFFVQPEVKFQQQVALFFVHLPPTTAAQTRGRFGPGAQNLPELTYVLQKKTNLSRGGGALQTLRFWVRVTTRENVGHACCNRDFATVHVCLDLKCVTWSCLMNVLMEGSKRGNPHPNM